MSGLEPLMIGALVAGSAVSAVGSVMAGQEKQAASNFEAEQYEIQAQQARTAAVQDETQRRRELTSNLEAVQAIRAGRGVGAGSPTGTAIFTNTIGQTEDDIVTSRANYLSRADLASRASTLSERKGKTSLLAGYLGAAEAVAGGITKGFSIGKAPLTARG